MATLPAEYMRLKWIESTGTQYIRTEIYPLANDVIEIRGRFTSLGPYRQIMVGSHRSGVYRKAFGTFPVGTGAKFIASAGAWNENSDMPNWAHNGTPIKDADTNTHTFIFSQADVSLAIDGVRYSLQTTQNPQAPGNGAPQYKMILFGYCHDTLAQVHARSRFCLETAIFRSNGVVVRNYIPALRIADKKPGLYDTVSQSFFTNADTDYPGSEDFKYVLADHQTYFYRDYQEMEWIKTNGTQNANVGVFPNTFKLVFDGIVSRQIDPPGSLDGIMSAFGTTNYGGSSTASRMVAIGASQANTIVMRVNGAWPSAQDMSLKAYERHVVQMERVGNAMKLSVDGVQQILINQYFDVTNKPFYFGGAYHNGSATIYSAQVYNGENLYKNLIPVKNLITGQFGLYETIAGTFYPFNTNVGLTYQPKNRLEDRFLLSSSKTNVSEHKSYRSYIIP